MKKVKTCNKVFLAWLSLLLPAGVSLAENGQTENPPKRIGAQLPANEEQIIGPNETFTIWTQDETLFKPKQDDKVEVRKSIDKQATTHKLKNVVKPIGFASGKAQIPESYVTELREVLDKMKNRHNVRLHFVGHSDNAQLYGELKEKYQEVV